jgi:hypothetical protein
MRLADEFHCGQSAWGASFEINLQILFALDLRLMRVVAMAVAVSDSCP